MSAPDHFDFYTFVLFLHIASAVIAFGATFAFPIIDVTIRRIDLRALPVWSEAQNQIGVKADHPRGDRRPDQRHLHGERSLGQVRRCSGSASPA